MDPFVNPWQFAFLNFLKSCVAKGEEVLTETSLSQVFNHLNKQLGQSDVTLQRYLWSASVDGLVVSSFYKVLLGAELQSRFHDSLEAQLRDQKKLRIFHMAGVPLIYGRIWNVCILELWLPGSEEKIECNLYSGKNCRKARQFVRQQLYQPYSLTSEVELRNDDDLAF